MTDLLMTDADARQDDIDRERDGLSLSELLGEVYLPAGRIGDAGGDAAPTMAGSRFDEPEDLPPAA